MKLGPNSLDWLRVRIGRIEKEIKLYVGQDRAAVQRGQLILKLANETLGRLERALLSDGPSKLEGAEIEETIREIDESQWGLEKDPKLPW